jgi:hypothetical protein
LKSKSVLRAQELNGAVDNGDRGADDGSKRHAKQDEREKSKGKRDTDYEGKLQFQTLQIYILID